jgi:hygromycin-B 4-O-kinase
MQARGWHVDELYPARVAAFARSRLGADVGVVEAVAHGEWSRAFTCGKYVVRFSALEEDFRKDARAAQYASSRLPIPRILDLGQAFDGFYAISERARGAYLDDLDAPALGCVLPALLAALDDMRAIDVPAAHGYGVWRADATAPHASWRAVLLDVANDRPENRTYGWRAQLAASPGGCARFDQAYSVLESRVASLPDERHLVHADLLNFNVLVDGPRVSAVLDWGSSLYGDFLFDVAWFTFWQPWYPAWLDVDFRAAALDHYASIGLDVPHFAERMRCYETFIGLENQTYSAFKGRWDKVDEVAQRTLAIARGA